MLSVFYYVIGFFNMSETYPLDSIYKRGALRTVSKTSKLFDVS